MTNVWSEEQLEFFYNNVLKDLSPTETDFFCLAARKKYMDEEDKTFFNLGDTCMLQKTILKEHNFKKFLSKVQQADACCRYFIDRNDRYLPSNCMTFYVNINHTNVLTAIKEFKKLLADWDYDVASLIDFKNHNKVGSIGKQLKTIQNNLLKSFQDPKHTNKKWVDIDCDLNPNQRAWVVPGSDEEVFYKFWPRMLKDTIKEHLDLDTYVVKTHGGCHVLINLENLSEVNKKIAQETEDKKTIKDKIITLDKVLTVVKEFFEYHNIDSKEIKFNQNMMIPMPGTIQGGFKVEMI